MRFNLYFSYYRTVDKVITQIDRLLPEMTVSITRPFASNVVLHVSILEDPLFVQFIAFDIESNFY